MGKITGGHMSQTNKQAIDRAKGHITSYVMLTAYEVVEQLLGILGADGLAAVVADINSETRPPDVIINLDRPDLRLNFGDQDLQIMHPIELWALGPTEPPPAGTVVHKIDTGELLAFRPLRKEHKHGYTRGLTI
jgi:hypothetical protein